MAIAKKLDSRWANSLGQSGVPPNPTFMGRKMTRAEEGDGFEIVQEGFVVEIWPLTSEHFEHEVMRWKGTLSKDKGGGAILTVQDISASMCLAKLERDSRKLLSALTTFLRKAL